MTETMNEQKIYALKLFGELQGVMMYSVQLGPETIKPDAKDPYFLLARVVLHNDLHLTLTGLNVFRFRALVPRLTGNVQADLELFFDSAARTLMSSVAAHATYPEVKL